MYSRQLIMLFSLCLLPCGQAWSQDSAATPAPAEASGSASDDRVSSSSGGQPGLNNNNAGDLSAIGFGPAFYVIYYDDEVLQSSNDVRVRGDGTVAADGSEYDFTFSFDEKKKTEHKLSPFLGVYDLDDGIKGIAAGFIYGYQKSRPKSDQRVTLNVGIGWTVHKDRLVMAEELSDRETPPAGLNVEDYSEKKDVEGTVLMLSANFGF